MKGRFFALLLLFSSQEKPVVRKKKNAVMLYVPWNVVSKKGKRKMAIRCNCGSPCSGEIPETWTLNCKSGRYWFLGGLACLKVLEGDLIDSIYPAGN